MSGISTGVGLISGIPFGDIVEQMMEIESRPKAAIENRNTVLKAQQEALQDIRTKLLTLKSAASSLILPTAFTQTTGTSSNEGVLGINSRAGAIEGNYAFTVARLVAAQQTITRGFADSTSTPVAPAAGGTLTFENGEARLESDTLLSDLNGGAGVSRGKIRITDRSGASTVVDLSAVATVDDVLEKINGASGVNVFAEVDGDALKLTDLSGGTAAALSVADVGTSGTATSLGLVASSTTGTLAGSAINTIGRQSLLTSLNDGNGVRSVAGDDLRISAGGTDYDVDLTGAVTIGDVLDRIDAETVGAVTAGVAADGRGLTLTGPAGLTVASLNDSGAAEDLGIAGTDDGAGTISGGRLRAAMNSKLVRNLNGGAGADLGTIAITNRAGTTTEIDLSAAASISEVITLINDSGAGVTASLNSAGNGLLLADATTGTGSLTIADVTGTGAADLNLAGTHAGAAADSGNLQFKYVTEGTRLDKLGVTKGRFVLNDSAGASAVIDLSNAQTIGDAIAAINGRNLKVTARVNDNGDGILLEDTGPGVVPMAVEEDGSTTAKSLGLLGEAAAPGDDLNGTFERTVQIASTDTLTEVARKINDAGVNISASVINDGSGAAPFRLSLASKQAGSGGAFVFDDGGLGLGATNLSDAQDAVVFYGSSDPARALAITSPSNTLNQLIPGASIELKSTSTDPVQVTISRNDEAIVESVQAFVDAFNEVSTTIDSVDAYDIETRERGILLGDAAVGTVRQQLFAQITRRDGDLTGQYNSLVQLGITVGRDSQLEFDQAKFTAALEKDPDAVEALFRFKQTRTNADGEEEVVATGIGIDIDKVLGRLTDLGDGTVQTRIKTLETLVEANNRRLEDMDEMLAIKRDRMLNQFYAMEQALAQMQDQSAALAGLANLAAAAK